MTMPSTELTGLVAAAALGLVHIVLASHSASLQRGYRWSAGSRDGPITPLDGVAGRLGRASANFLETFPFFAAATLAVLATETHSSWSRWGVILYLVGRIAYLPLYAFGVFLVRSVAWNIAIAGIAAIDVGLFV
ncbi:MAG: MAPEG family protein [Dokdonella sp.]